MQHTQQTRQEINRTVQCKLYKVQHTIVLPLQVRRTVHHRSVALQPIATTQPTTQHCCSAQTRHGIARVFCAARYRRRIGLLWAVGWAAAYSTADRLSTMAALAECAHTHSTRGTLPSRHGRAVSAPIALERHANRQTNKEANTHKQTSRRVDNVDVVAQDRRQDFPRPFREREIHDGVRLRHGTHRYSRVPPEDAPVLARTFPQQKSIGVDAFASCTRAASESRYAPHPCRVTRGVGATDETQRPYI